MRGKLLVTLGLVLAVVAIAGLASLKAQEAREAQESPEVIRIGSGGFLGVYLEEVDDAAMDRLGLREERGALISDVSEDGPAAEAGLLKDDVIIEFNGEAVESIRELSRLVRETPAGRTVAIGVIRDGREREISVELGERPGIVWLGPDVDRSQGVFIAPGDGEHGKHGEHRVFAFGGRGRLGVQLQPLGDQLAEYFGVSGGALIASVREDSPAAAAGLKAGDVITRVHGSGSRRTGPTPTPSCCRTSRSPRSSCRSSARPRFGSRRSRSLRLNSIGTMRMASRGW